MHAASRILVRIPTWVGDAVMATPALRALRAAYPLAHIRAEGRHDFAELLAGLDSIDAYTSDAGRGLRATAERVKQLRAGAFDLAVLLPDSPRAALGPFLARIPKRVGYSRDPLRSALLTDRLRHVHEGGARTAIPTIERYLAVTRFLGCPDRGTRPELVVDRAASERVDRDLTEAGVSGDDEIVVVTPGASFGASKLWPIEHFASACDGIAQQLGLVPVVAPGPGELDTARSIVAAMKERAVALARREPRLGDLKALIGRSRLVLSNDTGPRHIAVALDKPVVVVMGPTNPAHTNLHLRRQRVLRTEVSCSPCQLKVCPIDHRCMTGLGPERAVAAAVELLSGG